MFTAHNVATFQQKLTHFPSVPPGERPLPQAGGSRGNETEAVPQEEWRNKKPADHRAGGPYLHTRKTDYSSSTVKVLPVTLTLALR